MDNWTKERNEMSEIIANSFDHNGEKWDASDFEWSANCLQMAGFHKQDWISVKDDSPRENGIYCVMVEHRKSRKFKERTHARFKNGRWLDVYDDWENRCWTVTHWMPLPEPPKGGDKTDA